MLQCNRQFHKCVTRCNHLIEQLVSTGVHGRELAERLVAHKADLVAVLQDTAVQLNSASGFSLTYSSPPPHRTHRVSQNHHLHSRLPGGVQAHQRREDALVLFLHQGLDCR